MDIYRKTVDRNKNKFRYYSKKNNRKITDKRTLKRILDLKIPPNYTKVKISSIKNSKVQAIGEDQVGRKQYIYHKEFIEEQQDIKFQDLINFGKKIKRIRKDYKDNIEKEGPLDDKNKVISMVLYLLDVCNFRIGTEEYKRRYNTYGVTTLNTEHILFRTGEAEISFVGKKSIVNTNLIKNNNVIKLLNSLCEKNKGREFLFYYKDEKKDKLFRVSSNHISVYLKKYYPNLKPKMFRTWNGNSILLKYLLSLPKPQDEKEIKKNLREGIKKVAFALHNTVSVVKKSYCNSVIYETYLNNNELFFEFINQNRKLNGDKKSTESILTLFLIAYYKNNN
tara:strand:- start:289 stop:1296 length:1008 start_codon:yes stop_codon:yes gene_type:complete